MNNHRLVDTINACKLKGGDTMDNKIAEKRKEKHFTQTQLAKILDIDRTHLSKVENGKVRPSTALLERIANVLGCSIKDFFK